VDYDLHWRNPPCQPEEATLNGSLRTRLGKREFTDLSSGQAGQLLRLLSFDALQSKLRVDFRDTISEGISFDSIHSTA
ncbi:AsmA-like C-terminal region-containing protein, partial [Salmonella enterica]|uniref:YhdP family protein n=1 Tax=Salmonella enterica TaxID=28901 RepID=UPI0020C3A713